MIAVVTTYTNVHVATHAMTNVLLEAMWAGDVQLLLLDWLIAGCSVASNKEHNEFLSIEVKYRSQSNVLGQG